MNQETADSITLDFLCRVSAQMEKECQDEFERLAKALIIQQCSVAAPRGCFWNIITKSKGSESVYKTMEQAYKALHDDPNFNIWRICDDKGQKNSFLVSVDSDYMTNILYKCVDRRVWNKTIENNGIAHRQCNMKGLSDYLQQLRMSSGKAEPVVGIYNSNQRPCVIVNGIERPAFAVTFVELLLFCRQEGFCIVAKDIGGKFNNMRLNPTDLLSSKNKELRNKFMETLRYTPGTNALQVQISMLTGKELSNQMVRAEFSKDIQ